MRGLVLIVLACAALAAPEQPTFRAGVDLVTFAVTVTDKRGNLMTDLTQDDFEIIEDGKPQTVTYFTRGLGDGEGPAAHLGLMLDTSGSMERDLKLARSAAIKFLNMLPEAEDITLVDFDTEVRVTRYPQRDFARARRAHPHAQDRRMDRALRRARRLSRRRERRRRADRAGHVHRRRRFAIGAALRRADEAAAGVEVTVYAVGPARKHRADAAGAEHAAAADRRGDRRAGVLSRRR